MTKRLDHLPLTRETLQAAYDYLATTPPFNAWALPDSDEITFKVVRGRAFQGQYIYYEGKHTIEVSSAFIGRTQGLIELMAHEMIHAAERMSGCSTRAEHSRIFRLMALEVCRIHGFDPRLF